MGAVVIIMKNNIFLENYHSLLSVYDTQIAIKLVKDTFQRELAKKLELTRVKRSSFCRSKNRFER